MGDVNAARGEDAHRDFPGRIVLINLCRIGHVAGLAGVSAWVLAGPRLDFHLFAVLLVASGLGIMALDTWSNPLYLRQISGLAMLGKLGLVVLMALSEDLRVPLFWLILIYSVAISHAPGRIRHHRLF
jgi:hypothetical protein